MNSYDGRQYRWRPSITVSSGMARLSWPDCDSVADLLQSHLVGLSKACSTGN